MAYSADTFVADEQPTTAKWNKLWSNDAAFNDGTGFADGALGSVHASLANGILVQSVYTQSSDFITTTSLIPHDDTIPQNTEGGEMMTRAITPKSTTNVLEIHISLYATHSAAAWTMTAALFQDSTANALAAKGATVSTGTGAADLSLVYSMVAGTTSSTTFKVRAGTDVAGTTTFNGQSGARRYGAIVKSSIVIREYKAA